MNYTTTTAALAVWLSISTAQEPVKSASSDAADCVVLVSVQWGHKIVSVPGIVFHNQQQRTYVVFESVNGYFGAFSKRPVGEPEFKIRWGPDCSREVVGRSEDIHRTMWIVSGPAAQLPSPVSPMPMDKIIENMPLKIVGFPRAPDVRPANRVETKASLRGLFYQSIDDLAFLEIEGRSVDNVHVGVAMSVNGKAVAYQNYTLKPGGKPSAWKPLSEIARFRRPNIHYVYFAPLRGDSKTVRYQFVVEGDDPFGQVHSPHIYIKFGERKVGGPRPSLDRPAFTDGRKLNLTKKRPEKIVADQFHFMTKRFPTSPTSKWTAEFDAPHPGSFDKLYCTIQFAYKDADDKMVYRLPKLQHYMGARRFVIPGREPPVLPKIPGLQRR